MQSRDWRLTVLRQCKIKASLCEERAVWSFTNYGRLLPWRKPHTDTGRRTPAPEPAGRQRPYQGAGAGTRRSPVRACGHWHGADRARAATAGACTESAECRRRRQARRAADAHGSHRAAACRHGGRSSRQPTWAPCCRPQCSDIPLLRLELHQTMSGTALESVRDGRLDATFYFGDAPAAPLHALPLRQLIYRVAAPGRLGRPRARCALARHRGDAVDPHADAEHAHAPRRAALCRTWPRGCRSPLCWPTTKP